MLKFTGRNLIRYPFSFTAERFRWLIGSVKKSVLFVIVNGSSNATVFVSKDDKLRYPILSESEMIFLKTIRRDANPINLYNAVYVIIDV